MSRKLKAQKIFETMEEAEQNRPEPVEGQKPRTLYEVRLPGSETVVWVWEGSNAAAMYAAGVFQGGSVRTAKSVKSEDPMLALHTVITNTPPEMRDEMVRMLQNAFSPRKQRTRATEVEQPPEPPKRTTKRGKREAAMA